jgi:hypothetical protein
VGRPIQDEEELLELPPPLDADDEATGVPEAEELALADIDDGPEDIGLDTEVGTADAFEPGVDADEDDSALDDEPAGELVAEVDAEGEESGWLEESEGSGEPYTDEDLADDDEDYDSSDDGGLEGVDDPLADGLDDEERERELEDDDSGFGDELGEELLREIAGEGTASKRG